MAKYASRTAERRAQGLCIRCDTPSLSYYCQVHAVEHRATQKRRNDRRRKLAQKRKRDMDAILIVKATEHDCEYFCKNCGQLRLWLKGFKVTNCTACGSPNIETDALNSERLSAMRDNYSKESHG